jgi:vanillate O-demethylase monooxygenase subunit
MFLENAWYAAAWSTELKDNVFSRTILNQPILLFRKKDGTVAALEDRCPHRSVPLSAGKVVGDEIRCAYHGLLIASDGRCSRVPSQERIPQAARIRSYPALERHGFIWIWTGEAERADPASVPIFFRMTDPDFAATGGTKHVAANFELITDNLMDLSHVGFVHGKTIGTTEMGEKGQIRVERYGKGVRVTRWVLDVPPPPTHFKTGLFKPGEMVDRWQIIDFEPPSFVHIYVGSAPTGTGAPEGNRVGGLGLWIMNLMTPETDTTSFYFWGVGRDFHTGNPQVTEFVHNEISQAFDEDAEILGLQQRAMSTSAKNIPWVDLAADAGGLQSRRILRAMIREEKEGSNSPVKAAEPV